ncbi:MAG: Na/Pi cotransporter family protein [Halothiobacillaceae bacterium]
MEIFGTLFAGLGLFFIGVKAIGSHLKQMSGRRFRAMIQQATRRPALSAALGTLSGAVTQSTNAVTFIMVSMTTAGLLDVRRALPIVAWANVGTAALVMVATLDIHLLVLYLLGLVGLGYYLGLHEHDRYRHLVGALFGVGLLFLGLWMIKSGAEPLKDILWVQSFLRFSAESLVLAFVVGLVLTLVMQSSATVSVIAVTMTTVGLLDLDQTIMIVFGASVGSGLAVFLMSANLRGTSRQLALVQVWLKVIGVLVILPLFLVELWFDLPGLKALSALPADDLATQVAWIYLLLQVASAASVSLLGGPLLALAARWSPEDPAESLGRPKYLYDQALYDAESALDLAEREQGRLVERLPGYLDSLREDASETSTLPLEVLHPASRAVSGEIGRFVGELMARPQSGETLERVVNIHARNDLLAHLQEGCHDLVDTLAPALDEPSARALRSSLLEGLHMLLSLLADSLPGDPEDLALLQDTSQDRSGLMERIRGELIATDRELSPDSQARLFAATSLFERQVWLVNRYARLLARPAKAGSGSPKA